MTQVYPIGNTPDNRGKRLLDGTGGNSERPGGDGAARDQVLQTVGARTTDIRLTAGGTDVSAGNSAIYNFGVVDKASVGRYLFTAQSAASPTADPLGAIEWHLLEIREESAGVFKIDSVIHQEGLAAVEDAVQELTDMALATYLTDTDTPVFTTTNGDSDVVWSVATATTAATLNGLGADIQGGAVETNSLVLVETRSTTTEVWSVQRIS